MRVIAIVGMPGSGKTEAVRVIEKYGIPSFNMGDVVTRIELEKRGIKELNEEVENEIRMGLRKEHGPAAIAVVTAEEVEKMSADVIAIVGLHSFSELDYFKEKFGDNFIIIGIEAIFESRAKRSAKRKVRPFPRDEFEKREKRYNENFDIAKIVENADYKVNNDGTIEEFRQAIKRIIKEIIK